MKKNRTAPSDDELEMTETLRDSNIKDFSWTLASPKRDVLSSGRYNIRIVGIFMLYDRYSFYTLASHIVFRSSFYMLTCANLASCASLHWLYFETEGNIFGKYLLLWYTEAGTIQFPKLYHVIIFSKQSIKKTTDQYG